MLKKQTTRIVLAFIAASIVFAVIALCTGSGFFDVFAKITDGWIFGVLVMIAYDVITRLVMNRESINWVYIAMIVLIFINVVSFSVASETDSRTVLIAGLSVAAFFGAAAGLLPSVVSYIKAKRTGSSTDGEIATIEEAQVNWIKLRTKLLGKKPEKQKAILYKELLFKLKEDKFTNELNPEAPLISYQGLAYTVEAAEATREIPVELINKAKAYIDMLIG